MLPWHSPVLPDPFGSVDSHRHRRDIMAGKGRRALPASSLWVVTDLLIVQALVTHSKQVPLFIPEHTCKSEAVLLPREARDKGGCDKA